MSAKKITSVAATALAAGYVGLGTAHAAPTPNTFPGVNTSLTLTNGDNQLHFAGGGTEAMPSQMVRDADWAPDGSRVVYLDGGNTLISVRYDGSDEMVLATGLAGATHPTWADGGSLVVFAWNGDLYKVSSLGGTPAKLLSDRPSGAVDSAPQGGPNNTVVFQRTTNGVPRLMLFNGSTDNNLQGLGGSSPSISPDGSHIAYIANDSYLNPQVWVADSSGSHPKQLTSDDLPNQKDDTPVWSPDGSKIAFLSSGGVATIPSGGGSDSQVHGLSGTGRLSWQASANPSVALSPSNPLNLVERLDGPRYGDRIDTANAVAEWTYADWRTTHPGAANAANVVVIARSDIFADALAGSSLAARFHGPLLLTPTNTLDQRTLNELTRVLQPNSNATVYILGGTGAISAGVQAQISNAGYLVQRKGGIDRFETAIDIAKTIVPDYTSTPVTILAATGLNFPDALSAGAVAGSRPNTVVVLTHDGQMPYNTLNFIDSVPNRTVYGIGGPAVSALESVGIPLPAQQQKTGADRFATALLVARSFFGAPQTVGIATGYNFPDALAGGALVGNAGGPLLLTGPTGVPTDTAEYLREASGSVNDVVMFGGTGVINDAESETFGDIVGQPGQWTYAENNPAAHQALGH